jgi:glucans biosynthesis protein C
MATNKMPATGAAARLFFIDHLRASLVILVVIHHVAMVYGAAAPFYYVEPPSFTEFRTFQSLLVFVLVNQSFFMGALFLLAGYFTPVSYDRKGAGSFIKDKLLRLGIPLVAFFFVLNPASEFGRYLMPTALNGIAGAPTWSEYPGLIGLGPLWFVAMLLVFNLCYVLWRRLTKNRKTGSRSSSSTVGYLGIGIFAVALAGASYLTRMIVPVGKSVLDFPTLAYLPQYLSFFVIGALASRRDWFCTLPGSRGIVGFATAAAVGVFLFPLAFSGRMFSLAITPALGDSMGNGHWRSAVYALWDSVSAVGMVLGLITLFRRFFNTQGRLGTFLSQHSYAVYFVHVPVVVYLAYAFRGIELSSILKFGIASVTTVLICFAVANLIRIIPGVKRVL